MTILVTTLLDNVIIGDGENTLREALALAETLGGGDITFDPWLAGGVSTLTAQLTVSADVTIHGDLDNDGTPDITLDANANANADGDCDAGTALGAAWPDYQPRRVIETFGSAAIDGLVLTGGALDGGAGDSGDGGAILAHRALTLTNSVVRDNIAGGDGGGIDSDAYDAAFPLTLNGVVLSGNTAAGTGGGLHSYTSLAITDSTVESNVASHGGGISHSYYSATITDSIVRDNHATGSIGPGLGGGLALLTITGNFNIRNTVIEANSAADGGGGLVAAFNGGSIMDSAILNNSAQIGGGILVGAPVWITTVVASNTTIAHNSAETGGGVFVSDGLTERSGVYGIAEFVGVNSTITANSARVSGGGVYAATPAGYSPFVAYEPGIAHLANAIVLGNAAGVSGDDLVQSEGGSAASVVGGNATLVFAQTAEVLLDVDGDGAPETPSGILGGVAADNGGPTWTAALAQDAGNPALDAADPAQAPATDQRGVARPQGAGPDIGAFELVSSGCPDPDPGLGILGTPGDDSLTGGTGPDILLGGDGDDTLAGLCGDDSLRGEADDDLLDGGAGDDVLMGNPGSDTLRGGESDDTLNGAAGNDELDGGDGNDLLGGHKGEGFERGDEFCIFVIPPSHPAHYQNRLLNSVTSWRQMHRRPSAYGAESN